jgi:UDP-3-O-[3-hydroxymyristoyl] N-acetylglucosamine deacetylase
MDGSAGPFTDMIFSAGMTEQNSPKQFFVATEPIELKENGKFVGLYPSTSFKITYTIEYDHPVINKQTYSIDLSDIAFKNEISKARTFGFLHEYEHLKRFGLARGGSLDNTVVIDGNDILNQEGLRYPDEFVRHKILDSIGDFSLLGMPILGHLVISKSGHAFNHAFLAKFFNQKQSWETRSTQDLTTKNRVNQLSNPSCL